MPKQEFKLKSPDFHNMLVLLICWCYSVIWAYNSCSLLSFLVHPNVIDLVHKCSFVYMVVLKLFSVFCCDESSFHYTISSLHVPLHLLFLPSPRQVSRISVFGSLLFNLFSQALWFVFCSYCFIEIVLFKVHNSIHIPKTNEYLSVIIHFSVVYYRLWLLCILWILISWFLTSLCSRIF